jgi:hypothetical protein
MLGSATMTRSDDFAMLRWNFLDYDDSAAATSDAVNQVGASSKHSIIRDASNDCDDATVAATSDAVNQVDNSYKDSADTRDPEHEVDDYYTDHHFDLVTVNFTKVVDDDDHSTVVNCCFATHRAQLSRFLPLLHWNNHFVEWDNTAWSRSAARHPSVSAVHDVSPDLVLTTTTDFSHLDDSVPSIIIPSIQEIITLSSVQVKIVVLLRTDFLHSIPSIQEKIITLSSVQAKIDVLLRTDFLSFALPCMVLDIFHSLVASNAITV